MSARGYLRAVPDVHRGTVLTHMRASAPLRWFAPRVTDAVAWVYSTTLGGGLVGGDDIRITIDVEARARLLSMTHASTKVYRSTRPSRQHLDVTVGSDAMFVSLPDPVVPFAASSFEQRQRFTLLARGSVLAIDAVTSGRRAFGEHWAFDRYANRFEIFQDGRPLFYDHLRLDRADQSIAERMQAFNIYLVLVAAGPMFASLSAGVLADVAVSPIAPADGLVISASPLAGDGMVLRLAAVSLERAAATLRQLLRPIVPLLGDDPWARRH